MKRILTILFMLLILITTETSAQLKNGSFTPSVYYTHGSYSNNRSSDSFSFFGSLLYNDYDYLITGYDYLKIKSGPWDYNQHMIVTGLIQNYFPFFVKLNYAHLFGEYNYKPNNYSYRDYTNVYNAVVAYNIDLFYLGSSFTYLDLNGYYSRISKQLTINLTWLFSTEASIKLSPLYTYVSGGRKLYSIASGINYSLNNDLSAQANISIGEKAYYFDPDLLTIFNQDETQGFSGSIKVSYKLSGLILSPKYYFVKFNAYSINYFSVGVMYFF